MMATMDTVRTIHTIHAIFAIKNHARIISIVLGGSLIAGCAWLPGQKDDAAMMKSEPLRIVPHANIQDGADSAAAFHALGRQLHRQGKFADAERAYRRAIDSDPAHLEARNGLAVLTANQGNIAQAIIMLSALVTEYPQQSHWLTNLGYAHYLNGDFRQAQASLQQALAIAPDDQSAREKLMLVAQSRNMSAVQTDTAQTMQSRMTQSPSAPDAKNRNAIVKLGDGSYQLLKPAISAMTATHLATPLAPPMVQPMTSTVSTVSTAQTGSAMLRIELANGNGENRLARSLRDQLRGSPWQVVRVINYPEFNVPVTRIDYAEHHLEAARELAQTLGIAAQLKLKKDQGDTQLRVVLGHDIRMAQLRGTGLSMSASASPMALALALGLADRN